MFGATTIYKLKKQPFVLNFVSKLPSKVSFKFCKLIAKKVEFLNEQSKH